MAHMSGDRSPENPFILEGAGLGSFCYDIN